MNSRYFNFSDVGGVGATQGTGLDLTIATIDTKSLLNLIKMVI